MQTNLFTQLCNQRAALGIEPRTSRTRSENHTTRPSSRCFALNVFFSLPRLGLVLRSALPEAAWCGSLSSSIRFIMKTCRDPGSNRGPSDLQSDALPTELSRLLLIRGCLQLNYWPAHLKPADITMGLAILFGDHVAFSESVAK